MLKDNTIITSSRRLIEFKLVHANVYLLHVLSRRRHDRSRDISNLAESDKCLASANLTGNKLLTFKKSICAEKEK